MSPMEFIYWLDGFTEGRKELSTVEVDLIRAKMTVISPEQVNPYPISDPNTFPKWQEPHKMNPTCTTANDLLKGGVYGPGQGGYGKDNKPNIPLPPNDRKITIQG